MEIRMATETPLKKPLYICRPGCRRVTADGPALRVDFSNGASLWYPVTRVSRILAEEPRLWKYSAIKLVWRHGIPLMFVEGSDVVAFLGTSGMGRPGLSAAMELSLFGFSAFEYARWQEQRELYAKRHLHRALGIQRPEWRSIALEQWLRNTIYKACGRGAKAGLDRLFLLLQALLEEVLTDEGMNAAERYTIAKFDLLGDMMAVLRWPMLGRIIADDLDVSVEGKALITLFHAHLEQPLRKTAELHLRKLWYYIGQTKSYVHLELSQRHRKHR